MLVKLKCQECNGWLETTKDENIFVCEFCGTRYVLGNKERQVYKNTDINDKELYARFCKALVARRKELEKERTIIPFVSTDRNDVLKRFYIAADTEFVQPDFRKDAEIKDIIHVFIPMYLFDVSCDVSYSLEVGQTEYRQRWDEYKKRYIDEPFTVWIPEGGYLNSSWSVLTTGVNATSVSLPHTEALSDVSNRKEFIRFCKEISNKTTAITKEKNNSSVTLENYAVLPAMPKTDAWDREGSSTVKKEIDKAIRKRYGIKIRSLRWNGNIQENKTSEIFYPVTFVVYDYKELENQVVILDGVEEKYFRGVFPKSKKKTMLSVARWGVPGLFSLTSIVAYMLGLLDNSREGIWVPVLSVALGIVFWFWLGKIKGTGGDTDSEAAKNNRRVNVLFGIVSIVLAIIIVFMVNSSMDYNYSDEYSYTSNSDSSNDGKIKEEYISEEVQLSADIQEHDVDNRKNELVKNIKNGSGYYSYEELFLLTETLNEDEMKRFKGKWYREDGSCINVGLIGHAEMICDNVSIKGTLSSVSSDIAMMGVKVGNSIGYVLFDYNNNDVEVYSVMAVNNTKPISGTYKMTVDSTADIVHSSSVSNVVGYKGKIYHEIGDGAYYYLKLDQPIIYNGNEHGIIIFPNIENGGLNNDYLDVAVTVIGNIYEDYHGVLSIDSPEFIE